MNTTKRTGLIGDYDVAVRAHVAIPIALRLAGNHVAVALEFDWIPTEEIADQSRVMDFSDLWCVPASPYRSLTGALFAIRFARENQRPLLGTCGRFSHAILEYARSVLGWTEDEHAESAPEAVHPAITPLACELVEAPGSVRFRASSRIGSFYGRGESTEGYRCRHGVNPEFQDALFRSPLRACAEDAAGEVLAVDMNDHLFLLATLFRPERAALQHRVLPPVAAIVHSCVAHAAQQECATDGASRRRQY